MQLCIRLSSGTAILSFYQYVSSRHTSWHHGLIIRAKTDGLGDNVHPGEIIGISSLVGRRAASQPDQNLAQNLADSLVEYAVACMHSYDKVSPFESEL